MTELRFAPLAEFRRALDLDRLARPDRAALFATLCRVNVLTMIKRAGSGHIGTSFSCLDVLAWLLLEELRFPEDLYFSSKGHDAPALYAALAGLERLPFDSQHKLRRLGGLPGHPEVRIPLMEANTGSLGMGISKAKGMIEARRRAGHKGRVFVLTGDGELQEGQIWESLGGAAARGLTELTVIVDRNKIQSDTWVDRVLSLGDLEARFAAFGWHVVRCDGHDQERIADAFAACAAVTDRPRVIVADTIKGRGVSFMERFGKNDLLYGFHSGAPSDEHYAAALAELTAEADRLLRLAGAAPLKTESSELRVSPPSPAPRQKLVEAYGRELVARAARHPELVVLDADLVKDCGLVEFAARFPERFVECGIAEQDMVSQAGGMALKGLLPAVHSFACFLSARPNEQIYTNATEGSRILYVGTLAGLLPGTPGVSHQAVRDIASLGGTPGLVMFAPATEREVALGLDAFLAARDAWYLRLCSIPCIVPFETPTDLELQVGRGWTLREGDDAILLAYGPVMLAQAWAAAVSLKREHGLRIAVVAMPWLNRVDAEWLAGVVGARRAVFTLDDHYVDGGAGQYWLAALAERGLPQRWSARRFGVRGLPVCGQNDEVLEAHRLSAARLADELLAAWRELT